MDRRQTLIAGSLAVWMILSQCCLAEKLSPDQKAPPFARGSGGLILKAPFEGEQRFGGGSPPASNVVDGVEREETETLKEVDGQLVRTVKGHFAYKSPEGLPVYVQYTADENGNRASFKFGTAVGGAGGGGGGGGGGGAGGGGGGGGGSGGPRPGGGGDSTYLPPNKNVDRTYLPPQ